MKVLVVDDSATVRQIIKRTLNSLGLDNIIEADDGNSALTELRKDKIDLVLSDYYMPQMNGLDLLKAVRNDENLKDTPFIMMTVEGENDTVLEVVKAGVSDYIVKPFSTSALKERLERLFPD